MPIPTKPINSRKNIIMLNFGRDLRLFRRSTMYMFRNRLSQPKRALLPLIIVARRTSRNWPPFRLGRPINPKKDVDKTYYPSVSYYSTPWAVCRHFSVVASWLQQLTDWPRAGSLLSRSCFQFLFVGRETLHIKKTVFFCFRFRCPRFISHFFPCTVTSGRPHSWVYFVLPPLLLR